MIKYLLPVALMALPTGAFAADAPGENQKGFLESLSTAQILDGAEPGKVSAAGITVYGIFDWTLISQSRGAKPQNGYVNGAAYQIASYSKGSRTFIASDAQGTDTIGIKGNQSIEGLTGYSGFSGWNVVFDLQIGVDPTNGVLIDNLKTLQAGNGHFPRGQSYVSGDGSRAGQLFNGEAYVGIKHKDFGELDFGRINTPLYILFQEDDPFRLGYFGSLLSSGTFGGGLGDTEDARWNNSFRYRNTFGIVRVNGQYHFEGNGQGGQGYAFWVGVDLPGSLKGLTIDGGWGHQDGAITTRINTAAAALGTTQLLGTVQDDTAWTIAGKYNFEKLGLKQLTVFGGYENIQQENPTDNFGSAFNTIGGYQVIANAATYNTFRTPRQYDVTWVGGSYQLTPKVKLTGAWYHLQQNEFVTSTGTGAVQHCTSPGAGVRSQANCAGDLDWLSLLADYQWTKRVDFYVGVNYTQVSDGLAGFNPSSTATLANSGFQHTNTAATIAGVRYRF